VSEANTARLRLFFLVLLLANVLVFIFLKVRTDPNEAAAMRIDEVQIDAASVKLLGARTRGAGQPAESATASAACLEWAPISSEDVPAADSALEKLALREPAVRRPMADPGGADRFAYWVREPDRATVGRFAELQRTFPGTQITAGKCPDELAATEGSGGQAR
jgi:hypothetical protein